jgi:hypothetical protein
MISGGNRGCLPLDDVFQVLHACAECSDFGGDVLEPLDEAFIFHLVPSFSSFTPGPFPRPSPNGSLCLQEPIQRICGAGVGVTSGSQQRFQIDSVRANSMRQ